MQYKRAQGLTVLFIVVMVALVGLLLTVESAKTGFGIEPLPFIKQLNFLRNKQQDNNSPSSEHYEGLFAQMQKDSMAMLMTQAETQAISRKYQAMSNVMKSRNDSEANIMRNMRS
jgi:lipopolysaccharide export LptBFGC system permease protein LptF